MDGWVDGRMEEGIEGHMTEGKMTKKDEWSMTLNG